MKLPGRAWLQFELDADADGGCQLRQTAIFDPVGVAGLAYWFGLFPLHSLVFSGLIKALGRKAEQLRETGT